MGTHFFTTQPTHLQYVHRDTVIEVPLLEHIKLQDQLALFRYLAGPFYNCDVYNRGGGPSASACEQLRKCFEGLLRYENDMHLHHWARHINVIDLPMSHWTETGDLESYSLDGYRGNCPTNLFQVFADAEEPNGLRGTWIVEPVSPNEELGDRRMGTDWQWNPQHIEEPQNLVEAVKAMELPETQTDKDKDTEAFIAEIDALMAEDDDTGTPRRGDTSEISTDRIKQ